MPWAAFLRWPVFKSSEWSPTIRELLKMKEDSGTSEILMKQKQKCAWRP